MSLSLRTGSSVRTRPVGIVLDAIAASACPVKTRHVYEGARGPATAAGATGAPATIGSPVPAAGAATTGGPGDLAAAERERERATFVANVLDGWLAVIEPSVDLRPVTDPVERAALTLVAMRSGQRLIVGPALPTDVAGHRSGSPDALLRSDTGSDSGAGFDAGSPRYHPVLVRWHKVLRRLPLRAGDDPTSAAPGVPERPLAAGLTRPDPRDAEPLAAGLRLESRIADFLQLAHHHRLLEAVGFAGDPWGAVISTDRQPDEPALTWVELDRPVVRVVDHDFGGGWRLAPLLERADAELAHRVAIADAVRCGGASPAAVVRPVVVDECRSCPWWSGCLGELDPDDLSLRIARGRLDRTEVTALRSRGVTTVADLAAADLSTLLPTYLPEVAHRPEAETRVRAVARRARMLSRGEAIERETSGPIEVAAAELEIDLDIETSAAGRIYLWGFAVDDGAGPGYVEFSRFVQLDERSEEALAREALGWLRARVEDGRSVRVFHYSGYEVAMIGALAARRPDDEILAWAATYARTEFVDLLEIVQANFFGAAGLGLKQVAVAAGFGWRDSDPGGLNSQLWFDQAVHDPDDQTRRASRRRVLAYNEDDVRATAHLRAWLRAQ